MTRVEQLIEYIETTQDTALDVAERQGLNNPEERQSLITGCGGTERSTIAAMLVGFMLGAKAVELEIESKVKL